MVATYDQGILNIKNYTATAFIRYCAFCDDMRRTVHHVVTRLCYKNIR